MGLLKRLAALSVLGAFAIASSGCVALAIPSLAYQGYQQQSGQKNEQSTTGEKPKKAANPKQPIPDSEIE